MHTSTCPRLSLRALLVFCTGCVLTLGGCIKEYDFERSAPARGTLGEELHSIWIKDAARSTQDASLKASMLSTREAEFVSAVDETAPEDKLRAIDMFFRGTLSMIDEQGTLPIMTRKLNVAMTDAAKDAQLMDALADTSKPKISAFVSPSASLNIAGYVTAYPQLGELTQRATQIVLDNDGFDDNGDRNASESNGMSEVIRTVSLELKDLKKDDLGDSLTILVRDMLLVEDARFAPVDATRPIYGVRYDTRGLPLVARTDTGVVAPFVDVNQDGLADIDERGDFVLGGQTPIDIFSSTSGAVERDAFGRASINNQYLYDYVDLNNTGLGFLVSKGYQMVANNVFSDLMSAMRVIMGGTAVQEDEQGPYIGFPADNPLMDLTHALIHVLGINTLPEIMEDTAVLFDEGEVELAGVVSALEGVTEIAEKYPNATLFDNQTIGHDLAPVLNEIASDPALWDAFMNALGDPMTQKAGESMATLISYRNTKATVVEDGPYDACFKRCRSTNTLGTPTRYACIRACPTGEVFKEKMDFSAPETPDNRSQLQAMWHMMWGLTSVPYAMDIKTFEINGRLQPATPALVRLEGGAEAFIGAIAGNLDLQDAVPPGLFTSSEIGPLLNAFGISSSNIAGLISLLSEYFGVRLDRKPLPSQLTRMFTREEIGYRSDDGGIILTLESPMDADGYVLSEALADGLFEIEASGMVDAVYPMAKAFSDQGKETLLLRLFEVVHKHYPSDASLYKKSNGGTSDSNASNLRSYEQTMRDIFVQGDLLKSLYGLSNRISIIKRNQGVDLNEATRQLVLRATERGFAPRGGESSVSIGGGTRTLTIANLSSFNVMIKAVEDIADRVSEDPEAEEKFSRAVGQLFDVVLKVERQEGVEPRFTTPGSMAMAGVGARYMASQARAKRDDGTLQAWLADELYADIESLWTSRLFSGLVSIAEQIFGDEENTRVLDAFSAYLLDAPRGREHVTLTLYTGAVLASNVDFWVPFATFLSSVLDPDRVWGGGKGLERLPLTSHGALILKRTVEFDSEQTGFKLINRGLTSRTTQDDVPLLIIADVVASYFRKDPTSEASFTAEDYRLILSRLADWLADDSHGMEQIYDLIRPN